MEKRLPAAIVLLVTFAASSFALAQVHGTEEFGMSKRQLVEAIERVEPLISQCMRDEGFEYVAADYRTVRSGMTADKSLPGLFSSEGRFINEYGFGIATLYTGKPPQLNDGYSPARIGLGERNIAIYKKLSPADQVAYNRKLFGENQEISFAVGLEIENFSRTGGCTRKAIEQVFDAEQLKSTYYNPKDALINKDPRMVEALKEFSARMREAGYDYDHPDDVEPDIRKRLYEITGGGTVPVEALSAAKKAKLEELQTYERAVAKLTHQLEGTVFDPVEDRIEREMFARRPQ
ncbi:MAG TPA: hypothetical protein VEK15_22820 [Vicinamibacteria bacterium]|nr:hypothetical protein [Vicinamibacteria bacterium]